MAATEEQRDASLEAAIHEARNPRANSLPGLQDKEKAVTKADYDAETIRLEKLIASEDAGKKCAHNSLAEKVAHNRERNRLQEVLRQHKLNYFELVAA